MNEKKQIIELIEAATDITEKALIKLQEINKHSQFDYVTSSSLSYAFDELDSLIRLMNKIIYQKQK